MTISEVIRQINLTAFGNESNLTTVTSPKRIRTINAINNAQLLWAAEPGVQWSSLRRETTIAQAGATTIYPAVDQTDPTIKITNIGQSPFDKVIIVKDKQTFEYKLRVATTPEPQGRNICTFWNGNIVFAQPFKSSDTEYGGDIIVPNFKTPASLSTSVSGAVLLEITNPMFIVYRAAAELVSGDESQRHRAAEFGANAQNIIDKLKEVNNAPIKEIRRVYRPAGRSAFL